MLSNMSISLILHKRISTTLAKAKELKKHVEPLITRAKEDTTHNRRMAFSVLQSKEAIKTLFGEVADKVGNRPGGYTRIIKTGFRLGDNAEMCIIEWVDFNELMLKDSQPAKKTTRRSRRGSGKPSTDAAETSGKAEGENKAATAQPASEAQAEDELEYAEEVTDESAEEAPQAVETAEDSEAAETSEEPEATQKSEEDKSKDSGDADDSKKAE